MQNQRFSWRRQLPKIALIGALLFMLAVSFWTLNTKPRLWTDEAVNLELSKSFGNSGLLDIKVSPITFSGQSQYLQSTGYPVTVPLGAMVSILGFSFSLARVYMIMWMVLALFTAYWFIKKIFDRDLAILSILLIATFATFYGSGRPVGGEVPGFVFLLAGLHFWLNKKSYPAAGIFWSLAVVSKPSIFLLLIPSIGIVLLREPRNLIKRAGVLAISMLPAALIWLSLVARGPLSKEFWSGLASFYRNPFSSNISDNVMNNLANFFHSTTLIYFSGFLVLIILARFLVRKTEIKWLYDFTLIYTAFSFIYYLRSPGWLRYIVIAEFLMFILLPHVLVTLGYYVKGRSRFFRKFQIATTTILVVASLAVIQVVQLFTSADLFTSEGAILAGKYLDQNFPDARIAVLNGVDVYSMLENPKKELALSLTGLSVLGDNALLKESLPDIVVSAGENLFSIEGADVLKDEYELVNKEFGFDIYKKNGIK